MADTTRRRDGAANKDAKTSHERVKAVVKSTDEPDSSSESEGNGERPDKPCHRQCESLFSSKSGFHNYRGLLNNCIILLVLSNSKNVISNILKYGILVNPIQWGEYGLSTGNWPSWSLLTLSWAFPLAALYCERKAVQGGISSRALGICHIVSLTLHLVLPVCVIFIMKVGPVGSFMALSWYTVLFLKQVSYMQVNWWCRTSPQHAKSVLDDHDQKNKNLVWYPDNLNIKDIVYFCFAPTLCYELNFPRTERIRKIFLIRRILEAVFIVNVILAIVQQWLIPTTINSIQPFRDMEYTRVVERVLLLALPNHLFWLLSFYWLFHSMMNVTGELMRFGDRQFYGDWWNSQNIRRFWQTWNIPVHRWASRHIYNPLVKQMKWPRLYAQTMVFFVSAFFHEYLVSIPLLMLRPWAFVSMLMQVPLGAITALPFMRGQIGNSVVWLSIILGQPVAILMYMHDYYWLNWAPVANATMDAAN